MPATAGDAEKTIELAKAATQANRATPSRQGNLIRLQPSDGKDILVSADLHGHFENFDHILAVADLENHPQRHLILQEVCHGGPTYNGTTACKSHRMLEAVTALKVRYPDRVRFILSNHELAEATAYPITKDGKMLGLIFRMGLTEAYGDDADRVHDALSEFITSCPLGVWLPGDILVTHSAPESVDFEGFDNDVFERPLQDYDFNEDGEVFRLVWGRDYRDINADAFADAVGAQMFIHGHTPCELGYDAPNSRQLILDCSARPAAIALLPLRGSLTQQDLISLIQVW